jgi:deazaflavin-dependent oxidoreductase (nitroreductase family)
MRAAQRNHNLFINSAAGARALSALQLPFFLVRPPRGYGVLTTTGRKTGKTRRRCVRAIRRGGEVYVVAIKGAGRTGWARNALQHPDVLLRLPGGTFSGRVREVLGASERRQAKDMYCESVHRFDYLTWMNWRKGRPTPAKIRDLLRNWFDEGTPLVVELMGSRRSRG